MSHVLAVAKFLDFSFISRFVYKLVSRLDERRVQRETYRQLSSMSNKELNDIGLHRGLIRQVAFENYSPRPSDNSNLDGWV